MHYKKRTKPTAAISRTLPLTSPYRTRVYHGNGQSSLIKRMTTATLVRVNESATIVNPTNISTETSST
jgi:hypothetical protein